MRFYTKFLVFILFAALGAACSQSPKKNQTPLETLKAYGSAYKKKDITAMKLLLSDETLKMHEQEAKAQNVTVDDIVRRETLFSENQTTAEFRNEKVDGDKATIEMKDAMGIWNTVQFVREDETWKIDRRGFANKIEQEVQQKQNELDNIINQGRIDETNINSNSNTNANPTISVPANPPADTNPTLNSNVTLKANPIVNANVNTKTQP
jgi:hypothetical protein